MKKIGCGGTIEQRKNAVIFSALINCCFFLCCLSSLDDFVSFFFVRQTLASTILIILPMMVCLICSGYFIHLLYLSTTGNFYLSESSIVFRALSGRRVVVKWRDVVSIKEGYIYLVVTTDSGKIYFPNVFGRNPLLKEEYFTSLLDSNEFQNNSVACDDIRRIVDSAKTRIMRIQNASYYILFYLLLGIPAIIIVVLMSLWLKSLVEKFGKIIAITCMFVQ